MGEHSQGFKRQWAQESASNAKPLNCLSGTWVMTMLSKTRSLTHAELTPLSAFSDSIRLFLGGRLPRNHLSAEPPWMEWKSARHCMWT